MTREQAKYPTPKDPGDDRGYGPSWRDVTLGLRSLRELTGQTYTIMSTPEKSAPQDGPGRLVWYLNCGKDRPWTDPHEPMGPYAKFPGPGFKTVPVLLMWVIEQEVALWEAWKALRKD